MSAAPDLDAGSWGRQFARLSVLAAFLSCTLNCVFSQVASRAGPTVGRFGWLVDGSSLLVVIAGVTLGVMGVLGGRRRRSLDTQAIAAIGLVLNVGILFVVVWYFTIVRS
jgi:hypothetical protein